MKNKFILGAILASVLLMSIIGVSAYGITGNLAGAGENCKTSASCSSGVCGSGFTCVGNEIAYTKGDRDSSTTGTSSSSSARKGSSSRSSGLKGWEAVEAADPNVGTCYVKSAKSGRATGKFLGFMFRD